MAKLRAFEKIFSLFRPTDTAKTCFLIQYSRTIKIQDFRRLSKLVREHRLTISYLEPNPPPLYDLILHRFDFNFLTILVLSKFKISPIVEIGMRVQIDNSGP